jgi:phage repressor protein C with HTH and peptisase S24 domain
VRRSPPADPALIDRLRLAIGNRSVNSVAQLSGIHEATIRAWLAGSSPGSDKLTRLGRVLGISLEWLTSGVGEMQPGSGDRVVAGGYVGERQDLAAIEVPLFDAALSAGPGESVLDPGRQIGLLQVPQFIVRDIWRVRGRPVAVRVSGTSMLPTLHDGALAIVDRSVRTIQRDGDVYALERCGELFVKRVFRGPNGQWVVRSDNPRAPEFTIGPDDKVQVLGRVAGTVARPPE